VYGHPVEASPLAKASAEDPRFAERFELYINGTEQGDNWSELNDPVELRRRFEAEDQRRKATGDEEAHPLDLDFVDSIEYGMPPTTGVGPGIERLAMLLTEADSIDEVMFFPLLRPRSAT
jgi:lysyl-tRNA synthetase class 2